MLAKNVGNIDRIIRLVLGIVLLVVGFAVMDGAGGLVLGIIGAVIFVTGLLGRCLLYRIINFNTLGVR